MCTEKGQGERRRSPPCRGDDGACLRGTPGPRRDDSEDDGAYLRAIPSFPVQGPHNPTSPAHKAGTLPNPQTNRETKAGGAQPHAPNHTAATWAEPQPRACRRHPLAAVPPRVISWDAA